MFVGLFACLFCFPDCFWFVLNYFVLFVFLLFLLVFSLSFVGLLVFLLYFCSFVFPVPLFYI